MSHREDKKIKISIITACYNAAGTILKLIESLRGQTENDFEWVVADGASTDGSLELLHSIKDINIVISSQPDFGLYDALNRAIKISTGDFYVVAGADDFFYKDAIANFRRAIEKCRADIIVAKAMHGRYCFEVKKGPHWLYGSNAFVANHSLATAFRKDLHKTFGFYSKKLPIAADCLFVIQAFQGGATHCTVDFVAGQIGSNGVSVDDWVGSATEFFRVQLITGCSLPIQTLLLLLRFIKGSHVSLKSFYYVLMRRKLADR